MTLRIVLSLAILVVAAALVLEMRSWRKGTRLVARHQKGYRLAAALMLIAALLMILFGQPAARLKDPLLQISYWVVVLVLLFSLVAVVLLDVRATLVAYRSYRREMFADLLEEGQRKK